MEAFKLIADLGFSIAAVIGGGFLFSKIGSSLIKKDGADVIIWIVWLFIVFGIYLGGDFSDFDNYRPN